MDNVYWSVSLAGLVRLLLLLCLLIALVNPVYSGQYCQKLPKFCFIHPGKRARDPQAIDTDQLLGGDIGLEQGTMQLSNNDRSSSLSKLEAIIALLMGPTQNDGKYFTYRANQNKPKS